MTLQELFLEIKKAQALLNDFQNKFLEIKEFIRGQSKLNNSFKEGWNRFNYYLPKEESKAIEFNMSNGFQYHIFNSEINNYWVKLDILQLMDGSPIGLKIDEPYLIFMFSWQYNDVPGWPSDPDYKMNDWIAPTIKDGKYTKSDEYYKGRSIFISLAKSISLFTSQNDILNALKDIEQELKTEVYNNIRSFTLCDMF